MSATGPSPSIDAERLRAFVRDVPDFPEPGIVFKDITPLLSDADAFRTMIDAFVVAFGRGGVDAVVGIESRGFILAAPVADRLGASFVPARKAGKLPGPTRSVSYALEYGEATLELHEDAIGAGQRVLVLDDVLATGGTAAAVGELVTGLGGSVVGFGFLIELDFLDGASKLGDHERLSLLHY
ncbi:MAG: adenine phosphoribosyltransferase [Nitriliruptoraceae bacterium]|nr:adenine phosphoribosyltransferase [Nitriliruptoraceae bacterium]